MEKPLKHLPTDKRVRLNQIKQTILSVVRPDKIVLFGLYADPNASACLARYPSSLQVVDVLVIVKYGDSRRNPVLQQLIEDKCFNFATVNCVVHNLEYVNERLEEGNYFLYKIQEQGVMLYDASQIPLFSAPRPNFQMLLKQAKEDFSHWSTQAKEFYQCAAFSKTHGYLRLSLFLLHQAAEQMYQAIILTFTGYKPTTHNIGKLRNHTARLSLQLCEVFPDRTIDDKRMFQLLIASYVKARYKHFDVGENDLSTLSDRVGQLLSLGETICQHQIHFLSKTYQEQNRPELSVL